MKAFKWVIVSTEVEFKVVLVEEEDLGEISENYCIVAVHETEVEAKEGVARAQNLEKILRPFWQAAVEHEKRLRNDMMAQVYQAAKPLAPSSN